MDDSEQLAAINRMWVDHGYGDGYRTGHLERMAELAVQALRPACGAQHPDRPDVRCTQDRHETGHIYHRNSDLGVEWWTSGDGVTYTIHDVLGPIQLTQAPVAAGVEIRVPYIGGATKSGTREQQPGRYHTLPPCEGDTDSRPSDVDYLAEPLHDSFWSELDAEIPPAASDHDPGTDAHTQVYRDLVPILEPIAMFLDRMGRRYREGNPRMTSELCRTAETHRDEIDKATGLLRDLIDPKKEADTGD